MCLEVKHIWKFTNITASCAYSNKWASFKIATYAYFKKRATFRYADCTSWKFFNKSEFSSHVNPWKNWYPKVQTFYLCLLNSFLSFIIITISNKGTKMIQKCYQNHPNGWLQWKMKSVLSLITKHGNLFPNHLLLMWLDPNGFFRSNIIRMAPLIGSKHVLFPKAILDFMDLILMTHLV